MFIIPLAGLSSRFFQAGYSLPKYQLMLEDVTVFSWAVSSFKKYFSTDHFLFICRTDYQTEAFIHNEIQKLGIKSYEIVVLDYNTLGQADTVYLGLQRSTHLEEELYIFNIDSKRHNFIKPNWVQDVDGYLEVFKGEGNHWSFIEPLENSNHVIRTTEKNRISEYCSDGLYYFKSSKIYCDLVEYAIKNKQFIKNELYIAPLYNNLIQEKYIIVYDLISPNEISFCGTPNEYELLLNLN